MIYFSIWDRENRFARKWQTVVCDFEIQSKIDWKVVYEEEDYIVVSWTNKTFLWFTWWTEIHRKCISCTAGVDIIEISWAIAMYDVSYSENIVAKKYECIRQWIHKNKDIVNRVKMYEQE